MSIKTPLRAIPGDIIKHINKGTIGIVLDSENIKGCKQCKHCNQGYDVPSEKVWLETLPEGYIDYVVNNEYTEIVYASDKDIITCLSNQLLKDMCDEKNI